MRLIESVRIVVGSFVVYGVVAACSAGASHPTGRNYGPMPVVGGSRDGNGGVSSHIAGGVPSDGMSGQGGIRSGTVGSAMGGDSISAHAGQGGFGGILDPVPEAAAEPKSGTRLKARMLTADDGSRQWNFGWYDSQRGENCNFILATDGVTRCLPVVVGSATAAGVSGPFADAACGQRLATAAAACSPSNPKLPKSAYGLGPLCGGSYSYKVYALGALYEGTTLYMLNGTSCVSTPVTAESIYYYQGPEEPAASFVGASEQVEP